MQKLPGASVLADEKPSACLTAGICLCSRSGRELRSFVLGWSGALRKPLHKDADFRKHYDSGTALVELHIGVLDRSWFFHLSYLNLTTKHGALIEFQRDSDPYRQDNASSKGHSAFEIVPDRDRTFAMEVVHVCLNDVAFRGHYCEMRYWHIVSNMDKPPPGVAADLTHIVAVKNKPTRIFWNGSPPKKPAAKKRKQPLGQGSAPKRARAAAVCDVQSQFHAIADGSLDANEATVAETVGDEGSSCVSSDDDKQDSMVADGRDSEQEFGHREVEEDSASSAAVDEGKLDWDKDSCCSIDSKDIVCPGSFYILYVLIIDFDFM